ncbi:MAG: hypothetical protein DRQ10_00405 [Candidatus Hydrothermota bacterium]|nr:MAG: hypothetical protein DRQ10_00405 [Candidatus Hydrothermae bacterium]
MASTIMQGGLGTMRVDHGLCNSRDGFTITELMLVIVIIAILAVIGLAQLKRFRYRSKEVEASLNMDAIRSHEFSFVAEEGHFLTARWCPSDVPGPIAVDWESGTNFDKLGFSPQGRVSYRYSVGGYGDADPPEPEFIENPKDSIQETRDGKYDIAIQAEGDIDGDGETKKFVLTEEPPGKIKDLTPNEH